TPPLTQGREGHSRRRLGARQLARELGRRDARDPRRLWQRPDLHRDGAAGLRALARERGSLEEEALYANRRALYGRRLRRVRALLDPLPAGVLVRVRGHLDSRGTFALPAGGLRWNRVDASR